jgi:hypothetical protein
MIYIDYSSLLCRLNGGFEEIPTRLVWYLSVPWFSCFYGDLNYGTSFRIYNGLTY